MKAADRRARARSIRGQRAGLITRLIADALDLVIVAVLLFGVLLAIGVVTYMLGNGQFRLPKDGPLRTAAGYSAVEITYLSLMWGADGQSYGKRILGLRALERGGGRLRPPRAFLRAVFVTFLGGPSLLWVAISRRNLAVHDIVLRTAVIYDWLPSLSSATPTSSPPPPKPAALPDGVVESGSGAATTVSGEPSAVDAEFRNPAPTG
jgi:uncharacterized RDD family membrane protein YckC